MPSSEYRNNPPQEPRSALGKTGNLENSTALPVQPMDVVKPYAHALLGLPQLDGAIHASSPLPLPMDRERIRAERRAVFERTGYIPPIAGGSPKRIELPTEEIETQYHNRVSVAELAQRYGVSRGTIYRRLHEVGSPEHEAITHTVTASNRQMGKEKSDESINDNNSPEIQKSQDNDFQYRKIAEFFANDAGQNVLEWFEETLPEIAERRHSMNREEFQAWFSNYLEQKWNEWKSTSSHTA